MKYTNSTGKSGFIVSLCAVGGLAGIALLAGCGGKAGGSEVSLSDTSKAVVPLTDAGTGTATTRTTIVDLATTYINTLSTAQQTATVVTNNVVNVEKWSNLPAPPSGTVGTDSRRNGVAYSTLSSTQQTAWNNVVTAVLKTTDSSAGLDQFNNIRAADTALRTNYNNSGYSGDYQYLGFVGTPSKTGSWVLQLGGHHNAHNFYFIGAALQTTVPYHLGVEPTSFTLNGVAYTPLASQKTAVTNLLASLTATQLPSAKITGTFNDVLLGAGQDARANFPTDPTKRGILVSNLTTAQQALVRTAIDAWVGKSPLAAPLETLYYSELSSTYVAYAGNSGAPNTVFTAQGDYIRIDGPHVWIEFVCQNGVVVSNQIHYHTIFRDRVNDYNAVVAGYTLYNHSN